MIHGFGDDGATETIEVPINNTLITSTKAVKNLEKDLWIEIQKRPERKNKQHHLQYLSGLNLDIRELVMGCLASADLLRHAREPPKKRQAQ